MPPVFTDQFSQRLNDSSELTVDEATDGSSVASGQALLAPGDKHLVVHGMRGGTKVKVGLEEGEKIRSNRPALDALFKSVAETVSGNILAVVLTGMGKDGRNGSEMLAKEGATILVQDEPTSTVYGMPKQVKEAVKNVHELPLDRIAPVLNQTSG